MVRRKIYKVSSPVSYCKSGEKTIELRDISIRNVGYHLGLTIDRFRQKTIEFISGAKYTPPTS